LQQVRFARTFGLKLSLSQATGPFDVPSSRAFRNVWGLELTEGGMHATPDCWDRLAELLERAVKRWRDIQEVRLTSWWRDDEEEE
jgi:hypothetical protein